MTVLHINQTYLVNQIALHILAQRLMRLAKSETQSVSSQQNFKRMGSSDTLNAWYSLNFVLTNKFTCFSISFFRTWYADLVRDSLLAGRGWCAYLVFSSIFCGVGLVGAVGVG
ncbi:hypothetical protein [Emticicia sp. SJ17W-69]|uniref:hypothetical protein n=1 Tax=Emticicia sp. SJ17W-69 TaxID=3421657 RepID=UPI003EB771C8